MTVGPVCWRKNTCSSSTREMAPSCKKCEAEITGIERIACRCCKSDFHRSCISGLNRPTFDAIVKNTSNLFWLCDNCNGRFDNLLQAMETDEVTAPAGESAKLVEVVDKLSGIVSELSKRLDNRPKSSYAGIVGSGSQSYEPGSKRLREDEQYEQHQPPREKVKTICGTRLFNEKSKQWLMNVSSFGCTWAVFTTVIPSTTSQK